MSKLRGLRGYTTRALLLLIFVIGFFDIACTFILSKEPLACSTDADCTKYPGTYDSAQDRMRTLGITADVLGLLVILAGGAALYMTLTSGPETLKSAKAPARPRRPLGQFAF